MTIKPLHRTMPCHGQRIRIDRNNAQPGDRWTRTCQRCKAKWRIKLVVAEEVSRAVGRTVLDCQWDRI